MDQPTSETSKAECASRPRLKRKHEESSSMQPPCQVLHSQSHIGVENIRDRCRGKEFERGEDVWWEQPARSKMSDMLFCNDLRPKITDPVNR
ncbi:hypothetical protein B566_EDAN018286, partial [Ephemera danica]